MRTARRPAPTASTACAWSACWRPRNNSLRSGGADGPGRECAAMSASMTISDTLPQSRASPPTSSWASACGWHVRQSVRLRDRRRHQARRVRRSPARRENRPALQDLQPHLHLLRRRDRGRSFHRPRRDVHQRPPSARDQPRRLAQDRQRLADGTHRGEAGRFDRQRRDHHVRSRNRRGRAGRRGRGGHPRRAGGRDRRRRSRAAARTRDRGEGEGVA